MSEAANLRMKTSEAVPILYYHSVAEGCLSVKPSVFRAQMLCLRKGGYRVVGVGEIATLPAEEELGAKTIALSFDDGFAGVCDNALPVLREFGFRATCFVVPGYVGRTLWGDPAAGCWKAEQAPGLSAFPMMSWAQVREWSEAGMEVGAHTLSHLNLNELPESEAEREIRESKHCLEEKLGLPVRGFCYPRGRYTDRVVRFVEKAGYVYACTTQPGHANSAANRFLLPRIPGPRSVSELMFRIHRIPENLFTQSALRIARYAESLRIQFRTNA